MEYEKTERDYQITLCFYIGQIEVFSSVGSDDQRI